MTIYDIKKEAEELMARLATDWKSKTNEELSNKELKDILKVADKDLSREEDANENNITMLEDRLINSLEKLISPEKLLEVIYKVHVSNMCDALWPEGLERQAFLQSVNNDFSQVFNNCEPIECFDKVKEVQSIIRQLTEGKDATKYLSEIKALHFSLVIFTVTLSYEDVLGINKEELFKVCRILKICRRIAWGIFQSGECKDLEQLNQHLRDIRFAYYKTLDALHAKTCNLVEALRRKIDPNYAEILSILKATYAKVDDNGTKMDDLKKEIKENATVAIREGFKRIEERFPTRKNNPAKEALYKACKRIQMTGVLKGRGKYWPPYKDESRGITNIHNYCEYVVEQAAWITNGEISYEMLSTTEKKKQATSLNTQFHAWNRKQKEKK